MKKAIMVLHVYETDDGGFIIEAGYGNMQEKNDTHVALSTGEVPGAMGALFRDAWDAAHESTNISEGN